MSFYSVVFILLVALTLVDNACVPVNNPAVTKLVGPLPLTSRVITFDDIGLQTRWTDISNGILPVSTGNQTAYVFAVGDPAVDYCAVTRDEGVGFPWQGAELWAGSSTEKPGFFLLVMNSYCQIKFVPPISAFTARFDVPTSYYGEDPFFVMTDSTGAGLECQSFQKLPPYNNYVEMGFASTLPIESIVFFNMLLVDNIRVLTCDAGYKFNGTECADLDECQLDNPCGEANCENTIGSYQCVCNPGFEYNNGTCDDIDECATTSPCSSLASCTNTNGSYTCECNEGYEGNGQGQNGCSAIPPSSSNTTPSSATSPSSDAPSSANNGPSTATPTTKLVSSANHLLAHLMPLISLSLVLSVLVIF